MAARYLAILRGHGVAADRALLKLSDEPMPSDPCTINAIGTVARFLKAHPTTREIRLRIPGDVMSDLLPAVDVWDQSAGKVSFESFRQEIKAAQDSGAAVGVYNNMADLPDQPLLRTRAFALSLWNTSLVGALCWWSTNYWGPGWGGGAPTPTSYSGTVMYPPLPGEHRPRSSLRWEALLDGLYDYEKAHLLQQMVARAQSSGIADSSDVALAIARGIKVLDQVRELVWSFPVHNEVTVQPFSVDAVAWDRWRGAAGAAIEALARLPLPADQPELQISADLVENEALSMGDTARIRYSTVGLQPNATAPLQVFAVVNGSLFGAGVDAASSGTVSVPLPLAGVATLRLVVLPAFPLATLYAGGNVTHARATSLPIHVAVRWQAIEKPQRRSGAPVLGIEYDLRRGTDPKWPGGCPGCDIPEGVPLVGRYSATNPLVVRQHALWLTRIGIDFITVDWTGICWGDGTPVGKVWPGSFAQRPAGVQQLLNNSLSLLRLYSAMRSEGIDAPRIVPILGFDNGPIATVSCLNEALAWLATVREQFADAFLPSLESPKAGGKTCFG